jgi:hypothetical protein
MECHKDQGRHLCTLHHSQGSGYCPLKNVENQRFVHSLFTQEGSNLPTIPLICILGGWKNKIHIIFNTTKAI